jgi:hypothetical protein
MQKTVFALLILFTFSFYCHAQEFRKINPIPRPGKGAGRSVAPSEYYPISRDQMKKKMKEIFSQWNNGDLSKYLADDFYDKTRLLDNMYEKVPRDARIRLLSVGETQIMDQREMSTSTGKRIVSTVSVTATTQIEFNDPQRGFRRLEGENEYIIRVTEEIR